jgi:hypothetical protein
MMDSCGRCRWWLRISSPDGLEPGSALSNVTSSGLMIPDRLQRPSNPFASDSLVPPCGCFVLCSLGWVCARGPSRIWQQRRHQGIPESLGELLLAAVQAVEDRVALGGIPCPRPLGPPAPIRAGRSNFAVVETWLPDPGMGRSRLTPAELSFPT